MARKKGPVVRWQPDPNTLSNPVEAAPEEDSLGTPSGSFSTSSRTSLCPHCNSAFQDMSIIDFRDHVAFCTRPSTADGGTTGSSLSTPPISPSQMAANTITVDVTQNDAGKNVEEEVATQAKSNARRHLMGVAVEYEDADHGIRPYVNPTTEFDYYGQEEVQEGSDLEQRHAATTEKFPFLKPTPLEVFDDYLKDPEDMTYDELYRRTAIISGNLHAWQSEWDAADKEIYTHEKALKVEERKAFELSKEALEVKLAKEKWEVDQIGETFKAQLSLSGKKFQEWSQEFQSQNPDDAATISRLQYLRSPQYAALVKKQKKADFNARKKLENEPLPDYKLSKEEVDEERRKRGRLMESVKFNDMKTADIYGFEYSSHAKHVAQQPMPARNAPTNPNPSSAVNSNSAAGQTTSDASRARTQRKKTRKIYEAEESPTPETEEEGQVPARRARKPKIFQDGVEITGPTRTSGSSTPAVRTFASGKRVGRPPTKSKLQAVQLAQPSETPDPTSGNETQNPYSLGDHEREGAEPRALAPSQEAQLHDAAESLVNQTVSDKAAEAILPSAKPKHPGGRPKKVVAGSSTVASSSVPALDAAQPKPRNKGGRPKKNPAPVENEAASGTVDAFAAANHNPKARGGRRVNKEAVPEDNGIHLGEENGVLESTEQDDGSRYTSAATTRPTTSDSNATFSTVASRRSSRPATRDKTNARETNARMKSEGGSVNAQDQSAQASSSGRSKRKRGSDDTDPSPIIVDPNPQQLADPPPKKRRTRTVRQDSEDVIEAIHPYTLSEASTSRYKRKRGDTINDSIAVEDPSAPAENVPALKKRKRAAKPEEKDKTEEIIEEDSDAGIDEESLDPVAREALRKKRVKKEKSRKLSRNMKARWASGGMKDAQETRKANNARKKAEKEAIAAALAAGLPPPVFQAPQASAPAPTKAKAKPKEKAKLKSKDRVATEDEAEFEHGIEVDRESDDDNDEEDDDDDDEVAPESMASTATATLPPSADTTPKKIRRGKPILPPRPASTRVRKPTRTAMGLDGADDDDDDLEQQFASEYDTFQALTSPRSPVMLGKRVRRSLVDLSQVMGETDEDDEDEDEDEEF